MRYVIDGYNLLFSLLQPDDKMEYYREALIKILVKQSEERKFRLTVVFDAHQTQEQGYRTHKGSLEIVYTDPGQTADAYILQHLAKDSIVVTSDQQLARHVKNSGYQTISIESFAKLIKPKKIPYTNKPGLNLQDKLFEYYLNAFESKPESD